MPATAFPVLVQKNEQTGRWEKKPAVSGWQHSTQKASEIRTPNIGFNVPNNRIIVDVDLHKNPNVKDEIREKFGIVCNEESLLQRTISGGEHHAFAVDPDFEYVQGSDLGGVIGFDTRCAGRGWICSGEGYDLQCDAIDARMDHFTIPELPASALALLAKSPETSTVRETQPAPEPAKLRNLDMDELRDALMHIDDDSYEMWYRIGGALHSVPSGFLLFDEWSQLSPKYNAKDVEKKWYQTSDITGVNVETIFYHARECGWRPERTEIDGYSDSDFDGEVQGGVTGSQKTLEPFRYESSGYVRLPRFCLEGLIQEGLVAFAGQSGLGKTLTIVPMAVAATGLFPSYHAQPLMPKTVHYFAEDPLQVERCLRAMSDDGLITLDDTFRERFVLHEAKRRSERKWAAIGQMDLGENPLVVMDTVSANCDIENENDATAVGRLLFALRQRVRCSIWLIGHIAKAQINSEQVTMRGSGAFGADAQQAITLTINQHSERLLQINKHRYEPVDYGTSTSYQITTHTVALQGVDELGQIRDVTGRYNLIEPDDPEAREAAREMDAAERAEETRRRTENTLEGRVSDALQEHGPMKKSHLMNTCRGQRQILGVVIDRMVRDGTLIKDDDGYIRSAQNAPF